ncbi:MAG: restriction endonuclease [Rikenellaceae bacterium]
MKLPQSRLIDDNIRGGFMREIGFERLNFIIFAYYINLFIHNCMDINIFPPAKDWRDLQNKVCLLFNQVGLIAETEKIIQTPRGEVEVDVSAFDPNSVDKISYIVECKNWNTPISQSIIHSFTTVMNETGCNIGYIVSKCGFQSGAIKYIANTNIRLFTFDEVQNHYYELWMINYFAPYIDRIAERCYMYIEPCNTARDKAVEKLNPKDRICYFQLYNHYAQFIVTINMMAFTINNYVKINPKINCRGIDWCVFFEEYEKIDIDISGLTLSEILARLDFFISKITKQFDDIFGYNIFN